MEELIKLIEKQKIIVADLQKEYDKLMLKTKNIHLRKSNIGSQIFDNKEKIKDFENKLFNINNYTCNKKILKIIMIGYYIFITAICTVLGCSKLNSVNILSFLASFTVGNIFSAIYCIFTSKYINHLLNKTIDPNYSKNELERIIKKIKSENKELENNQKLAVIAYDKKRKEYQDCRQKLLGAKGTLRILENKYSVQINNQKEKESENSKAKQIELKY